LGANDADVPPADYMPAGWLPVPQCVPQMGAHAVTPAFMAPSGARQTTDCLFTFYRGRMFAYEPKITIDALLARQDVDVAAPLMPKLDKAALAPTRVVWKYTQKYDVWSFYYADFKEVGPNGPI